MLAGLILPPLTPSPQAAPHCLWDSAPLAWRPIFLLQRTPQRPTHARRGFLTVEIRPTSPVCFASRPSESGDAPSKFSFSSLSLKGTETMTKLFPHSLSVRWARLLFLSLFATLLLAPPVFAQATSTSPWENAVNVLQQAFTSTIARGLSLVAIVVAGLTFAFGEGGSKRVFAGVLFGVGMAIAAVNFITWLFP